MKFYVPYVEGEQQAEKVWTSVRAFLIEQGLSTTDRRIRKVYFQQHGNDYEAEVGKMFDDLREETILILEAAHRKLIYLCTPNRGIVRGDPYLISAHQTKTYVVDFDRS